MRQLFKHDGAKEVRPGFAGAQLLVEQRLDDIPTYRLLPPFALAEQDVLAPPVDGHHIHLRLPRPEAAYAFRQEGHLAHFGYIAHINILVVFSLYK